MTNKSDIWKDKKFIRINHRSIDGGLFRLKGAVLKVLFVRLLLADDNGFCNFSNYWISHVTELDCNSVKLADLKLEELGWITINRPVKNGKKLKTPDGKWAKCTAQVNVENLPGYLRGVFRIEDRLLHPELKSLPTDSEIAVSDLPPSNSLNSINSVMALLSALTNKYQIKPDYEDYAFEVLETLRITDPVDLDKLWALTKEYRILVCLL